MASTTSGLAGVAAAWSRYVRSILASSRDLFDIEPVAVIAVILTDPDEFLAVLGAPGRDIVQGAVIVGKNFQHLAFLHTLEKLGRLQQVHGTNPVDQGRRGIGLTFG